MLKRCIIAENRKLHASPIWVIFFVLPLISAGYGTFNYLQNLEILTERWYSLWTQHTLFYSMLFFPAMVSAYAAYLWRLEHLGHNWNLIMAAPVRPFALFAAKLLIVVKLMCFTQCFVFVLYVACGRLFAGFSDWPPVSIVFYLVRGIFGGLAVAAVQLLLAMLIRSFAVPIFLGLVGGIAGILQLGDLRLVQGGTALGHAIFQITGGVAVPAEAQRLQTVPPCRDRNLVQRVLTVAQFGMNVYRAFQVFACHSYCILSCLTLWSITCRFSSSFVMSSTEMPSSIISTMTW